MIDPLEQALDCIGRAVDERGAMQYRLNSTLTENHQLRRQLERARERNTELEGLIASLEQRLEAAEQRVERSERATRDHIART